uniref:Transposase (putative) YhgA-like domain-containing protein n=1 Tax=Chlorobium chlorochromatii (strain CaD3) TaxID=340177 RepID=Q3ASR7_CHLCH
MINNLFLTNQRDNYDSPWKEAIEHYFLEFMAFFFPAAYASIDWSKPYHFLNEELRAIIPDAEVSNRVVDKLVQVQLLDGMESWLYIHIEVQSFWEVNFPERIFVYFYRIYDKYGKAVANFVVLADQHSNWRPTSYTMETIGSKLSLDFSVVKLLDFEPRLQELLVSDNVFGVITAAHLLTQKTKNKVKQRYEAKKLLMQLLLQRQWEQERINELIRVIDWLLKLPKELRQKLKAEIHNMEEEQKMKYVTSFERDAMEEGREMGLVEGMEKGKAEGLEEGLLKGRLEVAERLVASGMSKAEAALLAGVSVEML